MSRTDPEVSALRADSLYRRPIESRRSGALYNAFSYPTKIDPEAIALFIATHTDPGDQVLDVFAGSGTTGLAAHLCEKPTEAMIARAHELDLPVRWGRRSVVLYEISSIGSLLADVMCNPPEPECFTQAALAVVRSAKEQLGWMYDSEDPKGASGSIRHTIWSEVLVCSSCHQHTSVWEAAVTLDPLEIAKVVSCPNCRSQMRLGEAERLTAMYCDPLTGESTSQRVREPAFVYGRTGNVTWRRPPLASDRERLERVDAEPLPTTVPNLPLNWGDLYRAGYHHGIARLHNMYTKRNLLAVGTLWQEISHQPPELHRALKLLVLSYNATHSTLMTRVVVKRGMKEFVVTGAQSGVLYISSLPVEKNVFEGVRRKIKTFADAFRVGRGALSDVHVLQESSTSLSLPDSSVDYVFTDPPFGDFIPYSEINQVNEAWLGSLTDNCEEAIISRSQHKGAQDYEALMSKVFSEVGRVLKPTGTATVVFHSSKPEVWASLGTAFTSANLKVRRSSILDKTQVSFKQVVSKGSTRGDAVFLLGRDTQENKSNARCASTIEAFRQRHDSGESPQHLYSRYVAECTELARPVELTTREFYSELLRDPEAVK